MSHPISHFDTLNLPDLLGGSTHFHNPINHIKISFPHSSPPDKKQHHPSIETSSGSLSLIDVIKLRMYEMGLNQSGLAKILGVSPSRVSEYLSGKKTPTLKQGKKISESLNIDPAIVLGV